MPTAPVAQPRASAFIPTVCVTACALALLYFGPMFVGVFRPNSSTYPDFVQEWLSARNFWSGAPVYSPQRIAMQQHTGKDIPEFEVELPWNAHPPVAVMIALPFGLTDDYSAAHLAWNLITVSLFGLSLVLLARELGGKLSWWAVAGGVALVLSCNAILSHVFQGQLNFVVSFLLVLAWIADRRGYQVAAGVAVGTAAAVKLFPALLLVYFVASRRWRAVTATVLVGLFLNLVALALFGPATFETYVRDVLPSLNVFRGSWANVSLTGYWTRVGEVSGAPAFGQVAALLCQLAVVAAVWRAGRRASGTDGYDRAFALAVAGMLLASPVAWTHYFVILTIPLFMAWRHLPRGAALGALVVASAILWCPERAFAGLIADRDLTTLTGTSKTPGGVGMAVVGLSVFPGAIVALFLLVGFAKPAPAPAVTQSNP